MFDQMTDDSDNDMFLHSPTFWILLDMELELMELSVMYWIKLMKTH